MGDKTQNQAGSNHNAVPGVRSLGFRKPTYIAIEKYRKIRLRLGLMTLKNVNSLG